MQPILPQPDHILKAQLEGGVGDVFGPSSGAAAGPKADRQGTLGHRKTTIWLVAGASFDHVVKLNSYMTDIPSQNPILRQVWSKYLKEGTLPASTVVQVVALADPRYMLEIEVAVLPPRA